MKEELIWSPERQISFVAVMSLVAIKYGSLQVCRVLRVPYQDEGKSGDVELQIRDEEQNMHTDRAEISKLIQDGANTFLKEEYKWTLLFVLFFSVVIFFTAE